MLKQLGRWIAVGTTLVIGVVASAQQGRWTAQSDETTQFLVNMERQWAEADSNKVSIRIFQPTVQPTESDVFHDFRELWQSPRSCKLF
jgi:sulfatase maturation enzyme AslB (radical SAM superfamily)